MTMLATQRAELEAVGDGVLAYRDLPRPHVALLTGSRSLDVIVDHLKAAADRRGIAFAHADLRGVESKDVLWTIGTAIFRLVDPEPPIRPKDEHPAIAFRRLFHAVVRHDSDDYLLAVGPIDHLEAAPDDADAIYGALRAAVVEYERRLQIVFLVRADIIRRQVFWLSRPTMEFASFLDLVDR